MGFCRLFSGSKPTRVRVQVHSNLKPRCAIQDCYTNGILYSMDIQVPIRCSDVEKAQWVSASQVQGKSLSAWIRDALNTSAATAIQGAIQAASAIQETEGAIQDDEDPAIQVENEGPPIKLPSDLKAFVAKGLRAKAEAQKRYRDDKPVPIPDKFVACDQSERPAHNPFYHRYPNKDGERVQGTFYGHEKGCTCAYCYLGREWLSGPSGVKERAKV